MIPAELDLTIYKGTRFGPVQITCLDSGGEPVDLTGWIPYADASLGTGFPKAFTLAPYLAADPTTGVVEMLFEDEETPNLPEGTFFWDLLLKNPDGQILGPFVIGRVIVKPVRSITY